MAWEIVVGIETHAQLRTQAKMFSGAATAFGAPPNTQASAVDIALPGTLPVANRAAVEHAIRFGLAVKGSINRRSIFARKNYFYPDLPKGYQISQYESPIVQGGEVRIEGKTIRLTRAHLEEDAGKSLHDAFSDKTGIDLNRAGTPLLEIVSEPDLRGAKEAVTYARALHTLVVWIGVCDGNMQEGSFRCDANVSVRKSGDRKLGTRCEIKNLNSFRFMEQAIEYEARRQIGILEDGGSIEQETRLYDPERNETRSMRTKEDAHDYRYFPDPDLLPLVIAEKEIEKIRAEMPELPSAKRQAYLKAGLTEAQADLLTSSREMARLADAAFKGAPAADLPRIANLIAGPVAAHINAEGFERALSEAFPGELRKLAATVSSGELSASAAVTVIPFLWKGEGSVGEIVDRRDLRQISDASALEKLVSDAIAKNPKQVADYRAGKEKALQSLVGQVMKASQGKANPAQVNEILRRKLKA